MFLGLFIAIGANSAAEPDAFGVTFTGLTDGEARVGGHASIGYTTDPVSATETVKWSSSSNKDAAGIRDRESNPTTQRATEEICGCTLRITVRR
jgi:mevalonate pyrophosphate decarboxylase